MTRLVKTRLTLVAEAAIILALIHHHAVRSTLAGEQEQTYTMQPVIVDMGPFSMAFNANFSSRMDRLRIFKLKIDKDELSNFSSALRGLATTKISVVGDLVRCNELSLTKPQMVARLDCRPLESLVTFSNPDIQLKSIEKRSLHVVRFSIRAKKSYHIPGVDVRGTQLKAFNVYMLRPDAIERGIEEARQELGVETARSSTMIGSHVDLEIASGSIDLKCSANIVLNYDRLKESLGMGSKIESIGDIVDGLERGVLFNMFEGSCNMGMPVSVDYSMIVLAQRKFPYLSVKHHVFTAPLSLFEYTGDVKQTRAPDEKNPNIYNTSILLNSDSMLLPQLKFKLKQIFVNEDQKGWEEMMLNHKYLKAFVTGNWTTDSLVKKLQVFQTQTLDPIPALVAIYDNQPKRDDNVLFVVQFNRKLFPWLSADLAESSPRRSDAEPHDEL